MWCDKREEGKMWERESAHAHASVCVWGGLCVRVCVFKRVRACVRVRARACVLVCLWGQALALVLVHLPLLSGLHYGPLV